MRDDEQGLHELFLASYPRLVGVVGAVCGNRDEAEEAVQEAFVRLLRNWTKVSRYDDPEGWVRRVALRQACNRSRKFRNGVRAHLRHGPPADVPAPSPTAVDLERALEGLSRPQRAVIVLHRLGFDAIGIAEQLHVPVGTVKSRLARARATLAPLLEEDLEHHA